MNPALAAVLAVALVPQAAAPRPRGGATPRGAAARGGAVARGGTAEAERLAAEAQRVGAQDPAAALRAARRALALTVEFVPTEFVTAGRKGEVVEDEFQAARTAYRRHRAILYDAVGAALARQDPPAASRYQRRALLLDPTPDRGLALARSLNGLGRGREAFDTVQRAISGLVSLAPEAAAVIERAADVVGLPSAQAEIDRGRLQATVKAVELREGPLELPPGTRLSSTPVVRLDDVPINVLYASEGSCRSCSADLDEIARQVPKEVRVLAVPPGDDQDQALRQVLALYRRTWPLLLGRDLQAKLNLKPRSVFLVARGGWTLAVLKAPVGNDLGTALAALRRVDVKETVPRPAWNHRRVDRSPLPAQPGLLPEGLAPGEDQPEPPEFAAAVEAYRQGRAKEALAAFQALEAQGDGWLLPPEARIDRALCLAKEGQPDAARRILLRTGDSRFEDEIDTLLEKVGTPASAPVGASAREGSAPERTPVGSSARGTSAPESAPTVPVPEGSREPRGKPLPGRLFPGSHSPPPSVRVEDGTEVLMAGTPHAVIETKFGEMEIEFLPDKAPGHVKNFLDLARKGFYDGTTFHRVIPGFMIQGGCPNTKDAKSSKATHGTGGPGYTITAEFNDTSHQRGVVSMARANDPNSAGSQFFICVADSRFLDRQYSAFGRVLRGMEVADKIVNAPRDGRDNPNDRFEMKVRVIEPAA